MKHTVGQDISDRDLLEHTLKFRRQARYISVAVVAYGIASFIAAGGVLFLSDEYLGVLAPLFVSAGIFVWIGKLLLSLTRFGKEDIGSRESRYRHQIDEVISSLRTIGTWLTLPLAVGIIGIIIVCVDGIPDYYMPVALILTLQFGLLSITCMLSGFIIDFHRITCERFIRNRVSD